MRNPIPALLLLLLPLSAIAAPERVAEILEDQRLHGYPSSVAAIERLQSADDVPGADAPLDLRRRYHGALAMLSVDAGRAGVTESARTELTAMAEECPPCQLELLLSRAHSALRDRQPVQARTLLEHARQLLDSADPHLRLKFALVHADLANGLERLPDLILEAMAALEDAEQLGNTADQIRLMQLMVGANADLGHYQVAEELAVEVIARAETIGFVEMLALAHLNRGYLHALTGERGKQLQALSAAVAVSADDPALAGVEVISRANLADYFLSQGDFDAALDHARRARSLASQLDDRQSEAVALANEGIAMARLGQLESGAAALRESMRIAEAEDYKLLMVDINEQLVSVLEDGGRYREALQAMHDVAAVSEEITRQEREKAVLEVQEKYASERKSREIARLSAENRLKQAEVDARAWKQRLWAAFALAMALAAVPLVRWLTRSRRLNRRLRVANASLAEETSHDPLTGAYNRRHFDRLMAQRDSAPVAGDASAATQVGLMVLDLDHFKQINDCFGHEAGDAVLVEVARRLRGLLREQDAVVRWGGEEFVLVLPGTVSEGQAVLAGRVLRAIGHEPVRVGNRAVQVTVSIGCVAHPIAPGETWEEAFRLADAAMYLAKQRGRNQAACLAVQGGLTPMLAGRDLVAGDLIEAERAGAVVLTSVAGPQRLPATTAEVC